MDKRDIADCKHAIFIHYIVYYTDRNLYFWFKSISDNYKFNI